MTVLLIDANYITWRAFHSTGKNLDRGTTYGFLSTLQKLRDQFQPDRIAFCFDGDGPSKREEIFPDYKGNRRIEPLAVMEMEKEQERKKVRQEIRDLRNQHLPALGWRNVFHSPGLEADDVIASICKGNHDGPFVMVSADKDLYQLLDSDRVRMWEPAKNRLLDSKMFRDEWGIDPARWINVKAIAGCSSDNIPGVGGVGEKTAAKHLADARNLRGTKKWEKIQESLELIKFNMRLVGLPYEGTPQFKLRDDEATGGKWLKWCEANGMKGLLRRGRKEPA